MMKFDLTHYSILSAISALLALGVALTALLRKKAPGSGYLALLMFSVAEWSAMASVEYAAIGIPAKVFWAKLEYLGVLSTPVFFLLFALEYYQSHKWLSRRWVFPLFSIPLFSWVLVLTNELHGLIWSGFAAQSNNLLVYEHGIWFWIGVVGYSYMVILIGTVLLVGGALRFLKTYRVQMLLVISGALIPWAGNLIYTLGLSPIAGFEPTSFLFSLTGLLLALAIFRFHLLDLIPVALQKVVDSLVELIFVLDIQGRLVYINPAARDALGGGQNNLIGQPAINVLPAARSVFEKLEGPLQLQTELSLTIAGNLHTFFVRVSPLYDSPQVLTGQVIVLNDITTQKQIQEALQRTAISEERERMAQELHDNLGQVLSYLMLNAQTVRDQIEAGNYTAALGQLDALNLAAQSASQDVRQHILDINTQSRDVRSFKAVLENYVARFEAITGLNVKLSMPAEMIDHLLPQPAFFNLLRIIQEALANARKHSRASLVQIIMTLEQAALGVMIMDDGIGFDPLSTQPGFGLDIIRKRAAQSGAEISIRSDLEQGTQIFLKFALLKGEPSYAEMIGVRVLVVDDHLLFAAGIKDLLTARGLEVIGVARDGEEAVRMAGETRPDLILLDVNLPRLKGSQAVRLIRVCSPDSLIVMISAAAEDDVLIEAMQNGASGFLLKSQPVEEFLKDLIAIRKGEIKYAPGLEASLARRLVTPSIPMHEQAILALRDIGLSNQQIEIMELVAMGQVYKEVAAELHVSESAIKYHVERIQTLLKLENRAEVVARAFKIGLVPNRRQKRDFPE